MHILMSENSIWNTRYFRRAVATALIADGHRVTVLGPEDDGVSEIEGFGCRFIPLKMSVKGLDPLEELMLIRRFKRLFRSERPDIILSYTIKNNIFGAMAARHCGIPFLPNMTGGGTALLSGGVLWWIAKQLYRRAFARLPVVFFGNDDDLDLFVSCGLVGSAQARRLPGDGIDLNRFAATDYPEETDAPIFLMIARVIRDKGVIEYVEAAHQVKNRFPKARFQLLGPANCENRTAIDEDAVRHWHAEGIIEYLGETSDVRPFISAAHCVVLPSYREGTGCALVEASAMARPLIATDVPGCRSVVDREKTGLLCDARDGGSLASAFFRFLSLPHADRVGMGLAGRAKMEAEYDEAIVIAAYRQAIAKLVAEGQGN